MHTCLKCVFLLNVRQLYRTLMWYVMMRTDMHTNLACIAGIHAICWQLCTNVFIYPDRVEHCALNILTFIFVREITEWLRLGQVFFFLSYFLILLNIWISICFKICKINKSTWGDIMFAIFYCHCKINKVWCAKSMFTPEKCVQKGRIFIRYTTFGGKKMGCLPGSFTS